MNNSITQTIGRARRKLQLERLVKGAAILIAFLLLGSFLSTFLMARYNFSDGALWWSRLVGILGSLLLFGYYILRPLWYSPSKGQVARFLEERYPQLEERVSTAVEIKNTASQVHPELQRLIRGDARKQLAKISQPGLYYRQRSLVSLVALFSSLAIFTFVFLKGPEVYPYSLNKLLLWYDDSQAPIYSIEVTPGNVTVGKRSDQEIRASLKGFDSETARLMVRYENQPQWEETTMRPDPQGGDFVFIFFDIRDPVDYYVLADGIQSETYTLEVSEIPRVEALTVVLQFPGYTGLENLTMEDDGDIRALVGTQAELFIRADQPVQGGKINLERGGEVSLELLSPRELRGVFEISEDDYYRIHFQDQEDFWNPASDEYLIQALEDQPPIVSFTRPGRDQKVTNIEEIFAQIKAEDDYAVTELALRFSLNGDPEQEAHLDYPQGSSSFSTSHTFYLEEFDLQPGDFISYYAEARDAVSSSATDIYFLEVEPFDREYYQSQQSGGGGGGGGQRENIDFSKRQKELIAATFKLERDRERYSESEFDEDSQTLALVQQRLQSEVETVIDRMERRSAAVTDPRFQKMADHLKEAITHMEPAHHHLNQLETKEALPEEQKSLQQLLRAEALFKEIQVAFSQNRGGGGASAQDLADLVDLELDRTKNQYETLQQNRESDREQALDEALEKLKELARRQEQLVERHRQQAMQGSSGSNMSQQELIEEAERVARELERLSRQQQDPQLQNISRNLRQAVRDMRRAQSSGENNQEAQMRAQQALERLQEAREGLGQQRREQLADDLEQLKEQSQRLVEGQREVLDQIEDLNDAVRSGRLDENSIRQLRSVLRDKAELQEDLQQLEGNLHEGARKMESNQTAASRKLKQAALDIRDQRIPEKMEDGTNLLARGWTDMAHERERGIMGDLEQLANMIRDAERALGSGTEETPRERLQRALGQVGSLVENLESLEDRASGNSQESQDQEQQQGQQQGQQPGEQPGQQGSESAQGGQSPTGVSRQAGRNPNTTGVDPRQVGREWQERLQDAEDLRGLMEGRPELGRDVASLIRRMRLLDAQRLFTDAEELARLKSQVIDGFRQLELEINRSLDEEVENLLRLVDGDEVPPEFRQRVEEYYRSLANRREPD
ncbi:MAG: hypothetical protein O7D93_08895 [Acidobacteria bacterium]|nr:hypothetical protein [Acidobacteriota bacterium]